MIGMAFCLGYTHKVGVIKFVNQLQLHWWDYFVPSGRGLQERPKLDSQFFVETNNGAVFGNSSLIITDNRFCVLVLIGRIARTVAFHIYPSGISKTIGNAKNGVCAKYAEKTVDAGLIRVV
jgi:hypothetical protein